MIVKVTHNFRELKIWQESMNLAKEIYAQTSGFPSAEKYGLVQQMNRCVVSIPSNIAEGSSRSSDKAFVQYLQISLGSAFELETQLILSGEFGYINKLILDRLLSRVKEIQNMIYGFIRKLKTKKN